MFKKQTNRPWYQGGKGAVEQKIDLKVRTFGPEPESPLGGRHGLLCAHHLSLLL